MIGCFYHLLLRQFQIAQTYIAISDRVLQHRVLCYYHPRHHSVFFRCWSGGMFHHREGDPVYNLNADLSCYVPCLHCLHRWLGESVGQPKSMQPRRGGGYTCAHGTWGLCMLMRRTIDVD